MNQFIIDNISYIMISTISVLFISFLLIIIMLVLLIKTRKKYKIFMKGPGARSLESSLKEKFNEVDKIKDDIDIIQKKLKIVDEELLRSFQKSAVIKYDAFKEMGGKLSFVVVMLNKENDGFLINSVHSTREGCYIFIKEIIKGESFIELSKEETDALESAKTSYDYM